MGPDVGARALIGAKTLNAPQFKPPGLLRSIRSKADAVTDNNLTNCP